MMRDEHRAIDTAESRSGLWLRWAGAIGIATIAVMRCMIVFAPQLVFDTDPATDPVPLAGLAMAGSLWLDVALLLACAVSLLGETMADRGLDLRLIVLALIPVPLMFWHGIHDLGHLWRGSTWASAIIAAVTVMHLARDRVIQIVIASLLIGGIAALLVRGIGQISYEHADMIRTFEQGKDTFLAERGWAPDSAAARIFERRLRQPQPTGWFPSTNIFGTLAAFGLIAWTGLTIVAARARLQSGWSGAMGLLAVACAAGLWLTGSKGAIGTALVGLVLALLPLLIPRARPTLERFGGAICVGLVLLVIAAIVVRGTALAESFAGDKSLLFRWHYLMASARMFAANALTGVGADGFQDAYTMFRVPRNPEEVQSAHSMFADWLCTFGVAGIAWVCLSLILIWRCGCALRPSPADSQSLSAQRVMRNASIAAGIAVLLGFVPAMLIEWPVLDNMSLMMRGLGMAAFVSATALSAFVMARSDAAVLRWLLAAAAVAVVIHGQIEMSFHYAGSVVWAMCALGVAAAKPSVSARATRMGAAALIGLLASMSVVIGLGSASVQGSERLLDASADQLRSVSGDSAGRCEARIRVGSLVSGLSNQHYSMDARLPLAAAQQFELAARECDPSQRAALLEQAVDTLERAMERFDRQAILAAAVDAHARLAALNNDQSHWNRAIELATDLTRLDPHGIASWRNLGDILWAAGRTTEAAAAYQHALQNNANFELDELKQLSDKDSEGLRARIDRVRSSPSDAGSP